MVEDWMFFLKIKTKTKMSTTDTSVDHGAGGSSQGNKARQRHKIYQTGKERITLSLFADDMILYTGNAEEYTHTHTHHALKTEKTSSTRLYGAR